MIIPNVWTWIIAMSGTIFFVILLIVQMMMLTHPNSQKVADLLIGKGGSWHDETHFRSAVGFARADWMIIAPLLIAGDVLVLLGSAWGYILWIALGAVSLYFSVLCWVIEKKYTYPKAGPFAYYTYYWGVYCYWGIAILIYSIIKLNGVL